MEVCGRGWHGWLEGMDGNMCGDADEGGVKDKTEGYVAVTLHKQSPPLDCTLFKL